MYLAPLAGLVSHLAVSAGGPTREQQQTMLSAMGPGIDPALAALAQSAGLDPLMLTLMAEAARVSLDAMSPNPVPGVIPGLSNMIAPGSHGGMGEGMSPEMALLAVLSSGGMGNSQLLTQLTQQLAAQQQGQDLMNQLAQLAQQFGGGGPQPLSQQQLGQQLGQQMEALSQQLGLPAGQLEALSQQLGLPRAGAGAGGLLGGTIQGAGAVDWGQGGMGPPGNVPADFKSLLANLFGENGPRMEGGVGGILPVSGGLPPGLPLGALPAFFQQLDALGQAQGQRGPGQVLPGPSGLGSPSMPAPYAHSSTTRIGSSQQQPPHSSQQQMGALSLTTGLAGLPGPVQQPPAGLPGPAQHPAWGAAGGQRAPPMGAAVPVGQMSARQVPVKVRDGGQVWHVLY